MQGVLDDFSKASKGVAKNPKIPIWWGALVFVPDSKMLQITTLFCWTRFKKKKKVDFDTVRN